jgi:hypothetical protein
VVFALDFVAAADKPSRALRNAKATKFLYNTNYFDSNFKLNPHSQKMKTFIFFLACLLVTTITSCNNPQRKELKIDINSYYSPNERDSLLADMITYIYKKPREANFQSRFDTEYRDHYVNQLPYFKPVFYTITVDGVHYYYVIRPARSINGNTRGVGGYFTKDSQGKITNFVELFNTPILPEHVLVTRGEKLFLEMVSTGEVKNYLKNPDYVEWPDDRLKYDRERNEWRYDVKE